MNERIAGVAAALGLQQMRTLGLFDEIEDGVVRRVDNRLQQIEREAATDDSRSGQNPASRSSRREMTSRTPSGTSMSSGRRSAFQCPCSSNSRPSSARC
jgi:hypothetical protein